MEDRGYLDTTVNQGPSGRLWEPLQRHKIDREAGSAAPWKGETPKIHSHNHYTISQDRTAASGHSKEKLVAIQPAKEADVHDEKLDSTLTATHSPEPPSPKDAQTNFDSTNASPSITFNVAPTGSNHALQDYQMQLMLLEQQNKKRLMMARQEQDAIDSLRLPPPPGLSEKPSTSYSTAIDAAKAELFVAESQGIRASPSTRRGQPGSARRHPAAHRNPDGQMLTAGLSALSPRTMSHHAGIQSIYDQLTIPNDRGSSSSSASWTIKRSKAASRTTETTEEPVQKASYPVHFENPANIHGNSITSGFSEHSYNSPTPLSNAEFSKPNSLITCGSPYAVVDADQEHLSDVNLAMAENKANTTHITGNNPETDILIQLMQRHIMLLQEEVKGLTNQMQKGVPVTEKIQSFHCIEGGDGESVVYLLPPHWEPHKGRARLVGNNPVMNTERYLERHDDIVLAVYTYYDKAFQEQSISEALDEGRELPPPEPMRQEVQLVSDEMVQAAKAFYCLQDDLFKDFPEVDMDEPLQAPFFWWYHFRKLKNQETLSGRQLELFSMLTDWIEQNFAHIYDNVDEMFSRGVVSNETIEYLIRPGDVLVEKSGGNVIGHVATSLPRESETGHHKTKRGNSIKRENKTRRVDQEEFSTWKVTTRSHAYTGRFWWFSSTLEIKLPARPKGYNTEIEITSLNVIPLLYAGDKVRQTLERRGETFWKCRHKRLISYQGNTNSGQRFMIDFETFKMLHGKDKNEVYTELAPLINDEDQPPPIPELYLFPTTIHGFDLRRKEWTDLEVDLIEDVQWNKEAFKHLVADEETKELIQALVTNKLEAEKNTDMIEGKGNGLIMLLHGSPGTGKTFTAESVAEIAEKPLYSVTCGDIGTKPEEVEAYLESVFHLGKIWGCVVLLDEAEVFLEQRTLSDLKRNALVSVFLRALEYYEGILILTTNRVGTFDEAFKSRIQLALHYEKFTTTQRKQIWKNFFNRLKSLDELSIDFDDLECNIDMLASYEMNGRQIRNSITTARQLAQFKRKIMRFTHLKRAIEVAGKFDTYLLDLKDGFSDEQIARGENIR